MSEFNDHDLLISVHTKLDLALRDIKELKDNTAVKITELETYKAEKEITDDHETRIRRLEFWGAISIGIIYALEFYFQFIK